MTQGMGMKVLQTFNGFGKTFVKGQHVSMASFKGWPKGTVQRRMENGFLAFDEPEVEEIEVDELEVEVEEVEDLDSLSKAELVDYAQAKFNTELSANQPKAALIEAIQALQKDGAGKTE